MKTTMVWGIIVVTAVLSAATGAWLLFSDQDESAPTRGIVVIAATASSPSWPRKSGIMAAHRVTVLPGVTVIETATADDTGPGAAILRTRDGETTRVVVGGLAEGAATLKGVTDIDAIFTVDGREVTLPVIPLPPLLREPLPSGAEPYAAPLVVNPGMARR